MGSDKIVCVCEFGRRWGGEQNTTLKCADVSRKSICMPLLVAPILAPAQTVVDAVNLKINL